MGYASILPRYPVIIQKPRNSKVKFCKLIRNLPIDIPFLIYEFIGEIYPILKERKIISKEELKNLWDNFKNEIKKKEERLKVPILTWKGKEMFNYVLKRKPFLSLKKPKEEYILYLKIRWKIFLDYLENWPKELLETKKENSISELYGWLQSNWINIFQFGEKFGEFVYRGGANVKKTIIILGDYFVLEKICNGILELLNTLNKLTSHNPLLNSLIKQMISTAEELKDNILNCYLYSSYSLLRQLSENLARLYLLKYIQDNFKEPGTIVTKLIFAYWLASTYQKRFYQFGKRGNLKKEIIEYINNEKLNLAYKKFVEEKEWGWLDLFEFQKNVGIPQWQISYPLAKKLNEKLGILLEITSKIVHGNIILPPITSILEIKYFKHLLVWFLDALIDLLKWLDTEERISIGYKYQPVNVDKIKKYFYFITNNKEMCYVIKNLIDRYLNEEDKKLLKILNIRISDVYRRNITYSFVKSTLEKLFKLGLVEITLFSYKLPERLEILLDEIKKILSDQVLNNLNEEEWKTLVYVLICELLHNICK